jgi:hypothetical protein
VCARGHYLLHERPVRDPESPIDDWQNALYFSLPPSLQDGGFRLEFSRDSGQELCVLLNFPGKYRAQYPVKGYPKISKFRAILERLDVSREVNFWEGRCFYSYTGSDETDVIGVNFRARDNGILFYLHGNDWKSICNLFRRACADARSAARLGQLGARIRRTLRVALLSQRMNVDTTSPTWELQRYRSRDGIASGTRSVVGSSWPVSHSRQFKS